MSNEKLVLSLQLVLIIIGQPLKPMTLASNLFLFTSPFHTEYIGKIFVAVYLRPHVLLRSFPFFSKVALLSLLRNDFIHIILTVHMLCSGPRQNTSPFRNAYTTLPLLMCVKAGPYMHNAHMSAPVKDRWTSRSTGIAAYVAHQRTIDNNVFSVRFRCSKCSAKKSLSQVTLRES